MASRIDRREAVRRCGMGLAALALPAWRIQVVGQAQTHEVNINAVYVRGQWFYTPAGLLVQKGDRVRWLSRKWGSTVTAFHPSNDNHELRIPEGAKPFDSGLLGEDSDRFNTFEWTFDVEGTYDYFSRNHEPLGMVGRIVVGTPGGPGETHAPGYGAAGGRAPVFPAQARLLEALPSADIVTRKSIPYPRDVVSRSFPHSGI